MRLIQSYSVSVAALVLLSSSDASSQNTIASPADSEWERRTIEHTIQFIRLGYRDILDDDSSFRSMVFRTDCLDTRYVIPAIRQVEVFNTFDGPAVAEALNQFQGLVACVEFGRRDSPVLYLDFPYWTHLREGQNPQKRGTRISDEEFSNLLEAARKVFVDDLHADGYGVDEVRDRYVYFWWD